MKEFVQNILIFVIIITVLRGLIISPKYQQYFQFFSGILLILMFLTPVLSFFHSDRNWYHILQKKILQVDLADIKGEMKVAEDRFEQVLCVRYEEMVKEQVKLLAQERGITLEDMNVTLEKKEDSWEVAEVSGRIVGEEHGEGSENQVAVEAVTIGEEIMELKQEDSSEEGRALRNQICSSFAIGKEQVHLWK